MRFRFTIYLFALILSVLSAEAQEMVVHGRVTGKADDSPLTDCDIYVYKMASLAQDDYNYLMGPSAFNGKQYEAGFSYEGTRLRYSTEQDGTFEFTMVENGALLFYKPPFPPVLVMVGTKRKHNVEIETTQLIKETTVIGKRTKKTIPDPPPEDNGGNFSRNVTYRFKKDMLGEVEGVGRSNARVTAQAYIVTGDGKDTIYYFRPIVYDGEQFHNTQKHWSDDYLHAMADTNRLTHGRDSVIIPVAYNFKEEGFDTEEQTFFFKANIWAEDYIKTYYHDTLTLFHTGRVYKPFRFLEYTFDQCEVDRNHPVYKKNPQKEDVADSKKMNLKFQVGRPELNRSDEETMAALAALKRDLLDICNDPYSTLMELHFKGYSSPDGTYAKNKPLSDARTKTVVNEVFHSLPKRWQERVWKTDSGFVVKWDKVADLLEVDSLMVEASEVRRIIEEFPDNIDRQGQKIKTIKGYKEKIVPYLDSLRTVKCEYKTQVLRFLSKEEIYERYQNDKRRNFTLNEYWELFELVKDEKELETLYNRAMAHALRVDARDWALPANKLAVMYLKRKQVDTLLLAPFIDETMNLNQDWTEMNGVKNFYNDEAIVANQVQMFLLAEEYARAVELSSLIAEQHPMLRAIARCVGGYINYEDEADMPTLEIVKESSPRNAVIVDMCLARKLALPELYDSVLVSLNKLPQDDAMTYYLRAQRICMKYDNDLGLMRSTAFDRKKEDPNFRHPKDKEIPAASPEDIQSAKDEIQRLKDDLHYFTVDMPMPDVAAGIEADLAKAEEKLKDLETGEPTIEPYECKVSDAVVEYLKLSFAKDEKYRKAATSDWYITEDLFNEAIGIKKK